MKATAIQAFENQHQVKLPDWWPRAGTLVSTIVESRDKTLEHLSRLSSDRLLREPTYGVFIHLADRVYEHACAAITCYATGSAAASEVIARVAIEASTNIRYMLLDDHNSMLLAWLRAFINEDERQIEQWSNLLSGLSGDHRKNHEAGIEKRKILLNMRKEFVTACEHDFENHVAIDRTVKFAPQIRNRFEEIGELLAYRTLYARLSSQTHCDAEDTLNYLQARMSFSQELGEKMGRETIAYSEMLVIYGCIYYVLGLRCIVEKYCDLQCSTLESALTILDEFTRTISEEWSWG